VQAGPDGTIASLAVEQDQPRTHRLGIGLYERSEGGPSGAVLRRRLVISAEISGARCEVPVPAGEPVPDAVVLNDGDLTYAELALDPATLDALAAAAMEVGDPLTEAVGWNAAWRMVTTGVLAGGDFAGLVTRRLGSAEGGITLPVAGLEVLLERVVTAASRYAPDAERPGLLASVAAASLAGVSAAVSAAGAAGNAHSPRQRALAAGFAASASSGEQLEVVRSWLSGGTPDGVVLDGDLRGRLLRTLAALGLATEEGRDVRTMRRLARALYPATLAEPATLTATAAALERGGLSEGMRLVLQEQEAILRAALAARSVPRRWG
jgi:aminopeptidase N